MQMAANCARHFKQTWQLNGSNKGTKNFLSTVRDFVFEKWKAGMSWEDSETT